MRLCCTVLPVVFVLLSEIAAAQPPAEEQARVIEGARQMALRYSETLPNFICTEVVQRSVQAKKASTPKAKDVLTLDVAYAAGGESYKLRTVDGKPTNKTLKQVGGFQSTGEFGTMLKQIFEPESETRFHWARAESLNGQETQVYSYEVAQSHSKRELNMSHV